MMANSENAMRRKRGRRTGERSIAPSLDALSFYCKLCRAIDDGKKAGSTRSFRNIAENVLQVSVSELSRRLAALELSLSRQRRRKVILIERFAGSGKANITGSGRRLYDRARMVLDQHQQLTKEEPELRVAATNWVLLHVVGTAIAQFKASHPDAKLSVKEAEYRDILEMLRRGDVDIGIGPDLPKYERFPFARIRTFGPKIGMVLVCPPGDQLATKTIAAGTTIDLADLRRETLLVLPHGVQPGSTGDIPAADRAANVGRIELPHYSTIVEWVCLGVAKGIVPGPTPRLEQLHREGLLNYIPVPQLGQLAIAFYTRRSERPSRAQSELMRNIESGNTPQDFDLPWSNEIAEHPFPESICIYRYMYYLTWGPCGSVQWRRAKVAWQNAKQGEIVARSWDLDGPSVPREYVVRGTFAPKLVQWHAQCECDSYGVVFNVLVDVPPDANRPYPPPKQGHLAFVGFWSGHDDRRRPLSGPVILTSHGLTQTQGNLLVREANRRLLLNSRKAACQV